jgi:hypothetical protein
MRPPSARHFDAPGLTTMARARTGTSSHATVTIAELVDVLPTETGTGLDPEHFERHIGQIIPPTLRTVV